MRNTIYMFEHNTTRTPSERASEIIREGEGERERAIVMQRCVFEMNSSECVYGLMYQIMNISSSYIVNSLGND